MELEEIDKQFIINNGSILECRFYFSQDSEIETLTIKVYDIASKSVAEATIYWYLDDSSTIYLSNLFVNPDCRNKGLGTKLMDIQDQIGKHLKTNDFSLWVKEESWMHEWYKRRGYSDLIDHEKEGFIWMTKQIKI